MKIWTQCHERKLDSILGPRFDFQRISYGDKGICPSIEYLVAILVTLPCHNLHGECNEYYRSGEVILHVRANAQSSSE